METLRFVIPGPPRTKKNSQRMARAADGRMFPLPSRAFEQYQTDAGYFVKGRGLRLSGPLEVRAVFYMDTRRRVDLVNLLEALDDVLVHYGVVEDDNSNVIASHDGSRVRYDKGRPRVEVEVAELIDPYCTEGS